MGSGLTATAHGMARDGVAPDWPRLTAAELVPVVARYPGLGEVHALDWHSQRPFAASGLISCDGGKVFAKRHDPRVRTAMDLADEHRFIAHLRAHGAEVPRVLMDEAGATAVTLNGGVYEIHAAGEGCDLYRDAHSWTTVRHAAEAREAGAALARLHVAARGFDAPIRQTRLVVAGDFVTSAADPWDAIENWAAGDAMLGGALLDRAWRDDLARVLGPGLAAWRPFVPALEPCWVHGDFHVSNMLWRNGAVSAVLDFGLSNRASALYDLATAIERNAIAWLELAPDVTDIAHADLARGIVEGYAAVLAPPDMRALRTLLPIVHVEFALSELAYFHGITRNPSNADLAYTEFLLGHTVWFGTDEGQAFLDRLA